MEGGGNCFNVKAWWAQLAVASGHVLNASGCSSQLMLSSGHANRHSRPASRTAPPAATSTFDGCSIDTARDGSLVFRFDGPTADAAHMAAPDDATQRTAHASKELTDHQPGEAADRDAGSSAAQAAPAAAAGEAVTQLQDQLQDRRSSHAHAGSSAGGDASDNGHAPAAGPAEPLDTGPGSAQVAAAESPATAPKQLSRLGLDASDADAMALLGAFSDLATRGALADALAVTEALVAAQRTDVLHRLVWCCLQW